MHNNIITAKHNTKINPDIIQSVQTRLAQSGWALLRGFDMDLETFSHATAQFCSSLTFDPAREYGNKKTQKVNAGTESIGLHIENGNTPRPPDMIAFYSKKSASQGSQTTLCDGSKIYQQLSPELKELFSQRITVSRRLPETLWKQYIANEHADISSLEQVEERHIQDVLSSPFQQYTINADGSLDYQLKLSPCISGAYSDCTAFANAILGPSFNYQKPRYILQDGTELSDSLKDELTDIAEQFTQEINWQDGDVIFIDNKRMMHGRREIIVPLEDRELYIGMGIK